LTDRGKALLIDSHGKDYIDLKKTEFLEEIKLETPKTVYDVQELSKRLIEKRTSLDEFNMIKEFAYKKRITAEKLWELTSLHPSDSYEEKALAVNVAQKITPYVLSLNSGEWSLGIHTASSEGRKSKDSTSGLSNQVIICLEHLKTHGGADKLKVLTFTECDLTENDMIYFGNAMLVYPLSLNYLDFSYNRIGDKGTISFIYSFITDPKGKYPIHNIINLNLSNNNIGDDGLGHILAYIYNDYMPSLKVLHLEGNNFTLNPKIIKLVQNIKHFKKITIKI